MESGRVQIWGERLVVLRRRRMWTQSRLAREAGVSPTTVSGIESGRISRPHFGTLRKLAGALGVEPEDLLSPDPVDAGRMIGDDTGLTAREEEFERGLEGASVAGLSALLGELGEERRRLSRLYAEFPEGSEQRRLIKARIRRLGADSGSVEAALMAHPDNRRVGQTDHVPRRRSRESPQSSGTGSRAGSRARRPGAP
ncbi:MAG: helix-turn-helix transcriptional regulator [Actinomycetota bacterium]